MDFDEVKVLSATKAADREKLGERATEFLQRLPKGAVVRDVIIRQSSDSEFHCLSMIFLVKHQTPA